MNLKTFDGVTFYCLPCNALCKLGGKSPENILECPLGNEECIPDECAYYTELESYPALATIQTDVGKATIVYNGAGSYLTVVFEGESGMPDVVETLYDGRPANIEEARLLAHKLYSDPVWEFEAIVPPEH